MLVMTNDEVEELAHGQHVIVAARWILVISAFIFALWNPDPIAELRIQILMILLMAVANFYLHAQALMRRPILAQVIYLASLADIAVITLFVMIAGGFKSSVYIYYFPAILAFSVVFPRSLTVMYTLGLLAGYGIIGLATMEGITEGVVAQEQLQVLIVRLIIITSIAVCGNVYQRIEADRREAANETRESLIREIGQRARANDRSRDHLSKVAERS